jgi:NADH-quinone oxidoreductase subunit L
MDNLVYLVPLFPLLGFLINGLFRKSLSKGAIGIIGSGSILLSFIVSVILFTQVKANGGAVSTLFDFINVTDFQIPFAFQVDALSSLFFTDHYRCWFSNTPLLYVLYA